MDTMPKQSMVIHLEEQPNRDDTLSNCQRSFFTRNPAELQGERIVAKLIKSTRELGFTIVGVDDSDEFLQIKLVVPNDPAWLDGKLRTETFADEQELPNWSENGRVYKSAPEMMSRQERRRRQTSRPGSSDILSHAQEPEEDPNLSSGSVQPIEYLTVRINKGDLGFTSADSVNGQKVKKILDRSRCKNLQESDIRIHINGIDSRSLSRVVQLLICWPKGQDTAIKVKRGGVNSPRKNKWKSKDDSNSYQNDPYASFSQRRLEEFLEFFPPGAAFIGISIAIRVVDAVGSSVCVVSTFTYSAVEFPDSVARIFSWTRLMMSVAQMAGPIVGGALYEIGGFKMPFLVMGIVQTVMSLILYQLLPEYEEEREKDGRVKPTFRDILRLLCIPAIWIPFMTFIVSTMSNGFLSINLEPKVLPHDFLIRRQHTVLLLAYGHLLVEQADSYLEPNLTVRINKGDLGFGFTIAESANGQKVKKILNRCKNLQENDIPIDINGIEMRSLSHSEAVMLLKDWPNGQDAMITVQRGGVDSPRKNKWKKLKDDSNLGKKPLFSFAGLYRSKTPTADLYSAQINEVMPTRPKTPLVDTRQRSKTSNDLGYGTQFGSSGYFGGQNSYQNDPYASFSQRQRKLEEVTMEYAPLVIIGLGASSLGVLCIVHEGRIVDFFLDKWQQLQEFVAHHLEKTEESEEEKYPEEEERSEEEGIEEEEINIRNLFAVLPFAKTRPSY